jgi:hypothetical protein
MEYHVNNCGGDYSEKNIFKPGAVKVGGGGGLHSFSLSEYESE